MPGSIRRWRLVAVAIGLTVIAGAVALAMFLPVTPVSPIVRATASPSETAMPESPSPTAEPTPAPPATLALEWTKTAVFGDESAMEVLDATSWAHGMVAVGARYLGQIPATGVLPPTMSGAIWLSADGRSWDEVTPPDVFDRVRLHEVYVAGDGSLIIGGETWRQGQAWPREGEPAAQFWRSLDGRKWREIRNLLPAKRYVAEVALGPVGYVLRDYTLKRGDDGKLYFWESEIWFSDDGLTWEPSTVPPAGFGSRQIFSDVAAGEQGFVAVGRIDYGMAGESLTIASGSGLDWVAAEAPPHAGVWSVAAQEDRWIVIAGGDQYWGGPYLGEPLEEPQTTVWTSIAGIAWHQVSSIELTSIDWDNAPCNEGVSDLQSAGDWLVASVRLYCVAGNDVVEGFGSPRISLDGVEWHEVSIPVLSFDPTTLERGETGLVVRAAMASSGNLVLAGQSNGQATFWLGVPR